MEWHPPGDETNAHSPNDTKMQSGDGGDRSPWAAANENRSSRVELPALRIYAGFLH